MTLWSRRKDKTLVNSGSQLSQFAHTIASSSGSKRKLPTLSIQESGVTLSTVCLFGSSFHVTTAPTVAKIFPVYQNQREQPAPARLLLLTVPPTVTMYSGSVCRTTAIMTLVICRCLKGTYRHVECWTNNLSVFVGIIGSDIQQRVS